MPRHPETAINRRSQGIAHKAGNRFLIVRDEGILLSMFLPIPFLPVAVSRKLPLTRK